CLGPLLTGPRAEQQRLWRYPPRSPTSPGRGSSGRVPDTPRRACRSTGGSIPPPSRARPRPTSHTEHDTDSALMFPGFRGVRSFDVMSLPTATPGPDDAWMADVAVLLAPRSDRSPVLAPASVRSVPPAPPVRTGRAAARSPAPDGRRAMG